MFGTNHGWQSVSKLSKLSSQEMARMHCKCNYAVPESLLSRDKAAAAGWLAHNSLHSATSKKNLQLVRLNMRMSKPLDYP